MIILSIQSFVKKDFLEKNCVGGEQNGQAKENLREKEEILDGILIIDADGIFHLSSEIYH